MLRFILLLISLAASVFSFAMIIRFGLRGAMTWDQRICRKLSSNFIGFNKHFRIPFSIGVVPEYFYFLVLGRRNYFDTDWWALRLSSYLSLLLFIAVLFNRTAVQSYYSLSNITENGIMVLFSSGSAYWYLNMVNLLFVVLFVMIIVESIRMHKFWAPVRVVMYSIMSIMMAAITLAVLALIIAVTILYIAYRIIKFFMSSRKRRNNDDDDDESPTETLNNGYRRFRAELYEWEGERKTSRKTKKEERKTVIKRKRPKIERKPKAKHIDDDIPRIYPK